MLRAELNDAIQQPEAASAPKQPLVRPWQRHSALGFDLRYLCVCRRWENLLDLRTATLREGTRQALETAVLWPVGNSNLAVQRPVSCQLGFHF
jgi:hypothetical protein